MRRMLMLMMPVMHHLVAREALNFVRLLVLHVSAPHHCITDEAVDMLTCHKVRGWGRTTTSVTLPLNERLLTHLLFLFHTSFSFFPSFILSIILPLNPVASASSSRISHSGISCMLMLNQNESTHKEQTINRQRHSQLTFNNESQVLPLICIN